VATTSVASGLSHAAKIGIGIFAGVAGVAVIIGLAIWKWRQGGTKKMSDEAPVPRDDDPYEDIRDDEESGKKKRRVTGMSLYGWTQTLTTNLFQEHDRGSAPA
jgi:hypothetical protein